MAPVTAPHSFPSVTADSSDRVLARMLLEPAAQQKHQTHLTSVLRTLLATAPDVRRILVVCVGTPRNAGDSVGPLTGTLLQRRLAFFKSRPVQAEVHGSLDDPIHALNLAERAPALQQPGTFVLAVDASVGPPREITVRQGPLQPGLGLNRPLPSLGNAHILCGISPIPMGFFCAHLGDVLSMAEVVSSSLMNALLSVQKE